jgi:predicted RecB family nuclease
LVQFEAQSKFRDGALDRWLRQNAGVGIATQPAPLAMAIATGAELVIGATIEALGVSLTVDLLERQEIGTGSRPPLYVPILFSPRTRLAPEDSLLAALHGIVLAEALGRPVPFVKVVHGPGFSATRIKLLGPAGPTRLAVESRKILDALRLQIQSAAAPQMVLNVHCPSCEYRQRCRAQAIERDELSLLRGLSTKEIQAQKKRGISTVAQFACTFRPKSVGARRSKPPRRHNHALQALGVRDQKVYVARTPEIPPGPTRVFLDVEGLTDRDFYYLVGVVVERGDEYSAHSVWADDEADEPAIWRALLELLRELGDHTLFHYGSYERTYVKRMLRKYPLPEAPLAGGWGQAAINVLEVVRTRVYFPVYSNGLKEIATYLGATWGGSIGSGMDCLARRLRWEASRDETTRSEIIGYNRDDCLALRRVVHFLASLGSPQSPTPPGVVPVSEIAPDGSRRYGKIQFAIPEMESINKCARFDYQREKVLLRTDPGVKASVRRKHARARPIRRANAEVVCEPRTSCPACGSNRVTSFRKSYYSKLVFDLKFSATGVKRWVIRYHTGRQQCLVCRKSFLAAGYPTGDKSGHGLLSWAVYQHVGLRQSYCDVASSINDLFGYSFSETIGRRAQSYLAEIYRTTRDRMLDRLRAGHLIHADETKVEIKGGSGYVWAFSGTETVVYLYNPTREGTFLKETLGEFAGVLVSDFYAAYDSVKCPQQKCHIHLIRDINDDLLQHPFDEELKELARRYTLTLKPIVDTIGRYGLVQKRLARHKQAAGEFLDWVSGWAVASDAAGGYKARLEKYGERLFTFLDHEGVPWNNNIAENAIKLVVSRMRLLGKSTTESGLEEYLVFLSIYQTLRRKGTSFLKFLLSGETDLERYVGSRRRR